MDCNCGACLECARRDEANWKERFEQSQKKLRGMEETVEALAKDIVHLRVELLEANNQILAYEEREASRCPEDVGFVEYVDVLEKKLAAAREEIERLAAAINWALGLGDDFPQRQEGRGMYWWRSELRSRAALRSRADDAGCAACEVQAASGSTHGREHTCRADDAGRVEDKERWSQCDDCGNDASACDLCAHNPNAAADGRQL